MYTHEEEKQTLDVLDAYESKHPKTHYIMEFAEGDSYECLYLDEVRDNNRQKYNSPEYDEFWTAYCSVVQVIEPGPNRVPGSDSLIALNYRHFPVRITTVDDTVIFPVENS